ncbi:hypothetical protein [Rudanella lutea]|uniref:hypothetical protein n=1 Tax=Rudanella lutea TaxID=451374 RepID=UPI00039FF89B|nr:hypothetical protein [Rudanella lutea]
MQPLYSKPQTNDPQPLKESIRDMIRLQKDYQISDELFWEIFNARVLLNEHVDIDNLLTTMPDPIAKA